MNNDTQFLAALARLRQGLAALVADGELTAIDTARWAWGEALLGELRGETG